MFHNVLILCTGNICRSPLAQALLRRELAPADTQVLSAGIAALVGSPADPLAKEVARDHGLDLTAHRAQQATGRLLIAADLILTLDQLHGGWVTARFPELRGRTYKLGRWRGNMDIADPYHRPKIAFEDAFRDIQACVDDWVVRLN